METIYNKGEIIDKINEIASKIEDEEQKEDNEYDDKKMRELIYAQFIQGLKLSTR